MDVLALHSRIPVLESRYCVEFSTLKHQLLLKSVPILSIILIQVGRVHQLPRSSPLVIHLLHFSELFGLIHIYQIPAWLEFRVVLLIIFPYGLELQIVDLALLV